MHQSHGHRSLSASQDQTKPLTVGRIARLWLWLAYSKLWCSVRLAEQGLNVGGPPLLAASGAPLTSLVSHLPGVSSPIRAPFHAGGNLFSPPLAATLTLLTCPSTRAKVTPTNTPTVSTVRSMPTPLLPALSLRDLTLTSHCHPIAVSPVVGLQRI